MSVVFDKAIFQYPAHNSKSLNAMLSHKNSPHRQNKSELREINVSEGENSKITVYNNGLIRLI